MRTVLLTIEYDGTNYAGWQVQPNGISIQQVVEGALERLLKEPVRLHSSGRTDAGVHAEAMPASFTTTRDIPLRAFTAGLNALLPPDIAVRNAREVPEGFHPRREAIKKHYRYTLHVAPNRSPLARLSSWHLRGPLDIAAMRKGGGYFVGEHDFAAFRGAGCSAKTTVRRVDSLEITESGEFLTIDVTGAGFLRNMVRSMVGTLAEIGAGKRSPESVRELLQTGDRGSVGATAPPQGLSLIEVTFESFFSGREKSLTWEEN